MDSRNGRVVCNRGSTMVNLHNYEICYLMFNSQRRRSLAHARGRFWGLARGWGNLGSLHWPPGLWFESLQDPLRQLGSPVMHDSEAQKVNISTTYWYHEFAWIQWFLSSLRSDCCSVSPGKCRAWFCRHAPQPTVKPPWRKIASLNPKDRYWQRIGVYAMYKYQWKLDLKNIEQDHGCYFLLAFWQCHLPGWWFSWWCYKSNLTAFH